jgi:hypothetical protein
MANLFCIDRPWCERRRTTGAALGADTEAASARVQMVRSERATCLVPQGIRALVMRPVIVMAINDSSAFPMASTCLTTSGPLARHQW